MRTLSKVSWGGLQVALYAERTWNACARRACTEHFTHPQRESQCRVQLVSSCQLSRVAAEVGSLCSTAHPPTLHTVAPRGRLRVWVCDSRPMVSCSRPGVVDRVCGPLKKSVGVLGV